MKQDMIINRTILRQFPFEKSDNTEKMLPGGQLNLIVRFGNLQLHTDTILDLIWTPSVSVTRLSDNTQINTSSVATSIYLFSKLDNELQSTRQMLFQKSNLASQMW